MIADVTDQPKELAQLYNDFALPQRLWLLGVEMLALVGYDNRPYLHSLWDLALRQVHQELLKLCLALSLICALLCIQQMAEAMTESPTHHSIEVRASKACF